ncbi:High molecular weight rubredoxin [Candidatus Methylomirabilis lanthanidiphila]|uniref:High molecular weight rubredoxin n=1 Tax=Candidatus Methylomirabilis lanthanidiphila TaxID=2211376 RepID=A0A564ZHB4_9BACT|nr:flavin reductase family protein [Candidatus Methylomirabilis lanthanidiphila]VUZ83938.1 High molecular weight rubredoxin [Candidatus Methylomirabilis lanthanidiphila]
MEVNNVAAVLGKLDYEIFVLTAAHQDRRSGQIVCWVMPATIVPQIPRILVGIGRTTFTRELIEISQRFALNLLGKDQWPLVTHFGFRSGREMDKFATLPFERGVTGSPILSGTVGYLECQVRTVLDAGAGAHLFYLADVIEGKIMTDRSPLCLHHLPELLPPEDLAAMRRLLEQDAQCNLALFQGNSHQQHA